MKKLINILNLWYYGTFVKAVLVALLGYYCVAKEWFVMTPNSPTSVIIYTVIILYVVLSIPAALKLFSVYTKKLTLMTDETKKMSLYKRYAQIRIGIVAMGLFSALFFYYTLPEPSLIWVAGISAIALYLCKPTRGKIENELAVIEEPKEELKTDSTDDEPTQV